MKIIAYFENLHGSLVRIQFRDWFERSDASRFILISLEAVRFAIRNMLYTTLIHTYIKEKNIVISSANFKNIIFYDSYILHKP